MISDNGASSFAYIYGCTASCTVFPAQHAALQQSGVMFVIHKSFMQLTIFIYPAKFCYHLSGGKKVHTHEHDFVLKKTEQQNLALYIISPHKQYYIYISSSKKTASLKMEKKTTLTTSCRRLLLKIKTLLFLDALS